MNIKYNNQDATNFCGSLLMILPGAPDLVSAICLCTDTRHIKLVNTSQNNNDTSENDTSMVTYPGILLIAV